jgi:DNA repair ATPase RecN
MKKIIILVAFITMASVTKITAQSQEVQQLLLNVEKLAQFKQILTDMKKGYQIISSGYSTIKDLSQGNFSLHKTFLDGLMLVSPTVRKYKRVADIINNQILLVKEYKTAFNRYKQDGNFDPKEIDYLGKVYTNLFNKSLDDLDELTMVMTDSKLRMSDDERLEAVDRIHGNMQDKLLFLRHFNNNTTVLAVQRARERNDAVTMKKIYGINN